LTGTLGTAVIDQGNTSITYTAPSDYTGADHFLYNITDGTGGFTSATVHIDVTRANQPPVAMDDTLTVEEGSGVIIQVLINDSDPDGDALVIESIDDTGTTGTVVINSGDTSVTYLAPGGFTGTDQFNYMVSDGYGGLDNAVVTIEVEPESGVMGRAGTPKAFYLAQNHPNPCNPVTEIEYGLPRAAEVRLTLYDMMGREVVQLVNHHQQAGSYRVTWNGRDRMGCMVSSGIYIYHLTAGDYSKQCKMLLLR